MTGKQPKGSGQQPTKIPSKVPEKSPDKNQANTDVVLVGAVAGAFGVRGEVRIKSFTATPEDIFDYAPFRDDAGAPVLTVQSWKHLKDGFAAYTEEITSREEAASYKSVRLYARRDVLPQLNDDEFYHADLIGMAVRDLANAPLGVVKAVHNFGADDLLEVFKTPGHKQSWYLPFTKAATPHIDLKKREIIADPAPELLPGGENEPPDDGDQRKG